MDLWIIIAIVVAVVALLAVIASGYVKAPPDKAFIISGMKTAETAADMTNQGLLIFKIAMMILPLICIVIGFIIYRTKYILDEDMYKKIVEELDERKKQSSI